MTHAPILLHGVAFSACEAPAGAADHIRLANAAVPDLVYLASPAPAAADLDAALAHHRLLTHYAAEHPVIPARFGTVVPDPMDARRDLNNNARAFRLALEGLADRVEFTVELSLASQPQTHPEPMGGSGRSYLQARHAERTARKAAAEACGQALEEICARLSAITRDVKHLAPKKTPTGSPILSVSTLIARSGQGDLCGAVAAVSNAHSHTGIACRIVGPWPAYSFATLDDGLTS